MSNPSAAELLAGIRSWVEVESQTRDVDGVNQMMDIIAAGFTEAGADVIRIPGRDGFGDHVSVEAAWNDDGPGILILSHLDTVHPKGTLAQFPFRIDDDRAYGPGIYDMKGGAYLAFAAYCTFAAEGARTPLPLRYLIVADEEMGSHTSRALIEKAAENAKYVLVTEPARDGGKIVTGRRGTARYHLSARGRPSHSGTHHQLGRSAIKEIARHVCDLEAMTDHARDLTLNVGTIEGGTTANTIPEHCKILVDVRMQELVDAEKIDSYMKNLQPYDPDVTLTVTGQLNRPPYRKTEQIEALFQKARTLAAEIGFELCDMHTGGGSDGSFVAMKVPTLDGLGVDGAGAHTLEEHLLISSLQPRFALQRRLMETLA